MQCGQCGLDIADNKYYAHKEWKPLDPLHNHPSNIIIFCGPKCSLNWYTINKDRNEN